MRKLRILAAGPTTLLWVGLVATVGLAGQVGAVDVFVNQITTSARVERLERLRPGDPLVLASQDISGGVGVDAYAHLDDNNAAFQSLSGFNAVRAGGAIANGYRENTLRSSTDYLVSVTTGNEYQSLFLDYLVFPGVIGLDRFAPEGSRASISYEVKALTPSSLNGALPTGASGSATLSRVAQGGNVNTVATIDQVFVDAGVQGGSASVDGQLVGTRETRPFLATAYLGTYRPIQVVEIAYLMSASVSIPGYETAGLARIGDPFALHADAQAEVAKYFPGSDTPFRIRAEPAAVVPEPTTWVLLAVGMMLLAITGARRERRPVLARSRR